MNKQKLLGEISFGERIAEEEIDELASYFVETDQWRRLYSGAVDVIYGPKGSGKSALYSLLNARRSELLKRDVILAPAENPRGTPAFKDLGIDPPASEAEFVGLWKLYFASIISDVLDEHEIAGDQAKKLRQHLKNEGLVREGRSLQGLVQAVGEYARRALRPSSVESGVVVDPVTQLPVGFTGKITFAEPSLSSRAQGFASIDDLLQLGDQSLKDRANPRKIWILLDRLDVAFAESPELEQNALRALFRVYLDLLVFPNIGLKIFLRSDIWHRITHSGFREASHITRHMTIDWNRSSLLTLVVRRAVHNEAIQRFYDTKPSDVLADTRSQQRFFDLVFPAQVEVGSRKARTFDWMLARTRDGTQRNAPRELIHLLNALREVQVRRLEVGEAEPENGLLFARGSFKEAMTQVSETRLTQTLYAEYPAYRTSLEKLRGSKTKHRPETLARILGKNSSETVQGLVDVGFFELRGTRESPEYWVPFLYRDALQLVQGTAE